MNGRQSSGGTRRRAVGAAVAISLALLPLLAASAAGLVPADTAGVGVDPLRPHDTDAIPPGNLGAKPGSLSIPLSPSGSTGQLPLGPCTPESKYESAPEYVSASYGEACRRVRIPYGPITLRPGQNEQLIEPAIAQRPPEEWYAVRFKAGLVDVTGQPQGMGTQGMEAPGNALGMGVVHLHHSVWLSSSSEQPYTHLPAPFDLGIIAATGEEKTIFPAPRGYGMLIRPDDRMAVYPMIHNMSTQPREVLITADVDFITKQDGDRLGIVPIKPIFLDVQRAPIHTEAPDRFSNPVFNVQKGFGHIDRATGRRVCSWPKENCARHDALGAVTPQQGKTVDSSGKPIDIAGADFHVPKNFEGTLIGMGGHVHPGGIRDEVSLVRGGVEKPIFTSDAVYWRPEDSESAGGPVGAWDFAMTATTSALGWKVKIKE